MGGNQQKKPRGAERQRLNYDLSHLNEGDYAETINAMVQADKEAELLREIEKREKASKLAEEYSNSVRRR